MWFIKRHRGMHSEWVVHKVHDEDTGVDFPQPISFETEAEARRTAGVWNGTDQEGWHYEVQQVG